MRYYRTPVRMDKKRQEITNVGKDVERSKLLHTLKSYCSNLFSSLVFKNLFTCPSIFIPQILNKTFYFQIIFAVSVSFPFLWVGWTRKARVGHSTARWVTFGPEFRIAAWAAGWAVVLACIVLRPSLETDIRRRNQCGFWLTCFKNHRKQTKAVEKQEQELSQFCVAKISG